MKARTIWDFLTSICCKGSKNFANGSPALILARRFSFNVRTSPSTRPVGVWIYGVPYTILINLFRQKFLNRRPVKAVALSVFMVFGISFKLQYCSRNFVAVSPSVVLHRLAAGHLLYLSMESKIKNLRFWSEIGPTKSNWISSFGTFSGGRLFCSVLGMLSLMFFPENLHGMQLSHFRCIASVNLGHQNCFADKVILLMAGCPL